MSAITVSAPAKLNLTLDVRGKRPDGYHELATTMHQISLADTVRLETTDAGLFLRHDRPGLPAGEGNLAYRAARLMLERAGARRGLTVTLGKRIPVGAGLAGGSADAAAVLIGLARLLGLPMSRGELAGIGAEIGSDVPFCVCGGTAYCTGRGERVDPLAPGIRPLFFVLVTPDFPVATAEVFAALRSEEVGDRRPDEANFQRAFLRGDVAGMAACMYNVLESVSARRWPEIGLAKRRLLDAGALAALMSGSGPTVFGLFHDQEAAQTAGNALRARYRQVFVCRSYAA